MQTVLDSPAMATEAFPLNAMLCILNGRSFRNFFPLRVLFVVSDSGREKGAMSYLSQYHQPLQSATQAKVLLVLQLCPLPIC